MKLLSSAIALTLSVGIVGFTINANMENADKLEHNANKLIASQKITKSYILQGSDAQSLNELVANVGGNVSREFPIINAVSAMLTSQQADQIRELGGVRVQDDRSVMLMSTPQEIRKARVIARAKARRAAKDQQSSQGPVAPADFINNYIAQQVGANYLHHEGIRGAGVTVAVIDSGINMGGKIGTNLLKDSNGRIRMPTKYNAIHTPRERRNKTLTRSDDRNGHGTNVGSIIASTFHDDNGNYNGIAPDINLLSVKAFDENGASTYSIVLDSLNWILENSREYNIRVVNMSLGAQPISYYWQDPVNQAVMKLWDAGIVVVSSAGNGGKDGGISVPGNNPYIITVGSVSDNETPFDFTDDRLSTFSSRGPTVEGFIKPEIVAYGQGIATKMEQRFFPNKLKGSKTGIEYSEISGTSQAAALVTGIAALIIGNDPLVTPDDVKCRIIATARTANDGTNMTYSPFAQGAGLVNAYAAVKSTATNCANQGLNVKQDLAGINHFSGPARKNAAGEIYIELENGGLLVEGNHWGNGVLGAQSHQWGSDMIDLEGNPWGNGVLSLEGNPWGNGVLSLEGNPWGNGVLSIEGNHWSNGVLGVQGDDINFGDLNLQGNPWGNGVLNLQGNPWSNGVLSVEASD